MQQADLIRQGAQWPHQGAWNLTSAPLPEASTSSCAHGERRVGERRVGERRVVRGEGEDGKGGAHVERRVVNGGWRVVRGEGERAGSVGGTGGRQGWERRVGDKGETGREEGGREGWEGGGKGGRARLEVVVRQLDGAGVRTDHEAEHECGVHTCAARVRVAAERRHASGAPTLGGCGRVSPLGWSRTRVRVRWHGVLVQRTTPSPETVWRRRGVGFEDH